MISSLCMSMIAAQTRYAFVSQGKTGFHFALTRPSRPDHALIAKGNFNMKLILVLLGVILLVVAGVYFTVPADQLPTFMPGHEAGLRRVHSKHGIVAAIAGLVLIAAGWWTGRR